MNSVSVLRTCVEHVHVDGMLAAELLEVGLLTVAAERVDMLADDGRRVVHATRTLAFAEIQYPMHGFSLSLFVCLLRPIPPDC